MGTVVQAVTDVPRWHGCTTVHLWHWDSSYVLLATYTASDTSHSKYRCAVRQNVAVLGSNTICLCNKSDITCYSD